MTNEEILEKLNHKDGLIKTVEIHKAMEAARKDEAIPFNNWLADNYDFFEFGEPGKKWGKFWEDEEAGTEGFEVIEMEALYELYQIFKKQTNG